MEKQTSIAFSLLPERPLCEDLAFLKSPLHEATPIKKIASMCECCDGCLRPRGSMKREGSRKRRLTELTIRKEEYWIQNGALSFLS